MSDINLLSKGQSDWQDVINQNFQNINGDIIPFSDTGWLTDGLTIGENVESASSKYRIVTLGTRKTITINSDVVIKNELLSANWGTPGSMVLGFPSPLDNTNGIKQRIFPTDLNSARVKFVLRDLQPDGGQYGIYFDAFFNQGDTAQNYPKTVSIVISHEFDVS